MFMIFRELFSLELLFSRLMQTAPEKWRLLRAHGSAVGLPTEEDMGNSEVGHNALGAGRIFKQGYVMLVQLEFRPIFIFCIC